MKKVFVINPDGIIEGLYGDELAGLGTPDVERASRVEYNKDAGGWTVEFLLGRFAGCFLLRAYEQRKEALTAEIEFLNKELLDGYLGSTIQL